MARRRNYLAAATLMGWFIMHALQPANANAPSTFEPDAPQSAPAWFTEMTDQTWATPVSNTLSDLGTINAGTCNAWTGGCVDQTRKELILAANGGHGDGGRNDVLACDLSAESPAWTRIYNSGPTTGGTGGRNSVMNWSDGGPRAVHGWNRCVFGSDRVWYAGMDGAATDGEWSTAVYSFDRTNLAWEYHGLIFDPLPDNGSNFSWQAGSAAYDSVGNRIYSGPQFNVATPPESLVEINASTGAVVAKHQIALSGTAWSSSWAVVAHDLRVLIIGSTANNSLYVWDLTDMASGAYTPSVTGTGGFDTGDGAVYHQASRAVLAWGTADGVNIRKLLIPANPLTGTYEWSTVTPHASNAVTPPGSLDVDFQGAFSKFNIIQDMGNGQSALVFVGNNAGPVYVYKLPAVGV